MPPSRFANATAFYTVHKRSGIRAYLGVLREAGKSPCLKARAGSVRNDH